MSSFRELTTSDCLLLGSDAAVVMERFNEAVRLLQEIERKYPNLLEGDIVKGRVRLLDGIRSRLERKQYRVGFIGTFQAGKSTAFNNILDAAEGEGPSQSGSVSAATTSAITRVRRKDAGNHSLQLRYLTVEEFKEKRKKMCDVVRLTPTRTDKEILLGLPKYREDVRKGKACAAEPQAHPVADDGEILPEDLNALEHLLRSFEMYGEYYVNETRFVRTDVSYEERGRYLNHPAASGGKVQASPNFLLKDALIDFCTDKIPPELEIIDLPGLGSHGSIDTILTKGFLQELDAALVFVEAQRITTEDVERVLERLKRDYKDRLIGRVWLVITKVDDLRKHHFFGNEFGQKTFDTLIAFLDNHGIPAEQVCLAADKIYKLHGPQGLVKRDQAVAKLEGLSVAEPIPPGFKTHPQLRKAFEEVLKDGGVGHLRGLIAHVLAREVAKETRQKAETDLTPLLEQLRDDIQAEERRRTASPTELLNALTCLDRVTGLLRQWKGRIPFLDPLSLELKNALLSQFDKFLPREDHVLKESSPAELGQRLEFLGKAMEVTVHQLLDTGLLEKVFAHVGSQLADLPAVRVWNDKSPALAWERFGNEDRRDKTWRSRFPSFSCQRLFVEGLCLEQASDYRSLMRDKARTGSHQAMHALKVRIQDRLGGLREELSKLAYAGDGRTSGGDALG